MIAVAIIPHLTVSIHLPPLWSRIAKLLLIETLTQMLLEVEVFGNKLTHRLDVRIITSYKHILISFLAIE